MSTVDIKHKFIIQDCYQSWNEKLCNSVVQKVNEIDKTISVIALDNFDNHFLVRNGHEKVKELYREQANDKVQNIGFVTLVAEEHPTKKVQFGVWQRITSSEILR